MFPRLITIGSFSLPSYGVLVALAFLVALAMASRFAKQRGLNSEKIVNLGVYCALAGMLGAKVMMIALDPELRTHPAEIFSLATLQSAGIFFGGFIVALLFAFFYMRAQSLPVLATSDLFAPGLAIGHGIGRLGCFAAGCCWGKPTHLPWAVTFTSRDATTGVPLGIPLHPTQLYEAFAEAIVCLVLISQLRRPHRDGQVIGLYLILYGFVRFGVEFLREHDASNPLGGPFTLEQWIALILAIAGVYLYARHARTVTNVAPAISH
ncbi:MAG TPA: prolipoprotein diacylglyceryl transferase [Bryobacteraceae bacterium]|jgi:phosphatidylglycerol:prolipoprotein diacylglycerol transferase|nr:prolipoprotein diacylglyceryl transferase [Bryobacteraceae bacterium]